MLVSARQAARVLADAGIARTQAQVDRDQLAAGAPTACSSRASTARAGWMS
jgi:hypothetical protein